jgi:ABC-type oligopeptide transport system substrate-binding subunit
MKHLNIFCLAVFGLMGAAFFSACNNKCSGIACVTGPPVTILDIRDAQGRDLLNPATPNHYDTAKIRQLNNGLVRVFPPNVGPPNKERIKLTMMWTVGETTSYLKLSDNDQDTIRANVKTVTSNCCSSYEFTAFSYNGKANTDSLKSRYFIIVK